MQPITRAGRRAWFSIALLLAACAGQQEPARQMIASIQATVTAASAEASKYVPDRLVEVQTQLAALSASLDKKDYAAVLRDGPPLLAEAQSLAAAAAAKKDEILKVLNERWTGLAGSLPDQLTGIRGRIVALRKKPNKKAAAGIDLVQASAAADEAASLWSKAQAAFAAGNLEEAVAAGTQVQATLHMAAAALKMNASAPPTSS